MPRNGSGAYSRAVSAYVFNTIISQTDVNAEMDDIATALTASIAKDGQTTPTANLPMGGFKLTGLAAGSAAGNSLRYEQLFTTSAVQLLGAMDWVKGANIASATTINLTTATGNAVHVTGTTQIDAVTLGSGMWRMVIFDGILTLAHSATNNNLPGGANITTAANDRALYWSDGTTVYCAAYNKASGKATVAPAVSDVTGLGAGVATALAVNVGSAGAPVVNGGALGTPSSGDLSNCTGYPESTTGTLTAGTPLVLNPYSASSTTTQAHGLGANPSMIDMTFECITGEGNWSAGDKIKLGPVQFGVSSTAAWNVSTDSTNVVLITSNEGVYLLDKTARTIITATPANWKLTITPYKLN